MAVARPVLEQVVFRISGFKQVAFGTYTLALMMLEYQLMKDISKCYLKN